MCIYSNRSSIVLAVIRQSVLRAVWAHLRVIAPGQHSPFEEISLPCINIFAEKRAVGNTVSDLTGPRFESQISRFRDERVTFDQLARMCIYLP